MKKSILKILALVLIVTTIVLPPKRSEAGVVLLSGGTMAVPAVVAMVGGVGLGAFSVLNAAFCGFSENTTPCIFLTAGMFVGGIGLVILDEDGKQEDFKTVSSYLLEEIKAQSLVKGESLPADENGLKQVVFTDAEVDVLFELADDYTSTQDLKDLRSVLTTSVQFQSLPRSGPSVTPL